MATSTDSIQRPLPLDVVDLTGQITLFNKEGPTTGGGYADVYQGIWKSESFDTKIAVKVFRLFVIDDRKKREKISKRVHREVLIWHECKHENILPFYGVISNFGSCHAIVSPWMERGNINDYLNLHHSTLQLDERLLLLCDVANGLQYLHSRDIVHGDLTAANILIGSNKKACLSDFGLSQVISEFQRSSFLTSTVSGAYRWLAPELVPSDDDIVPDIQSSCDIYSFGSIMLQVLSGQVPYYNLKQRATILLRLQQRTKPDRPTEIANDVHWQMIEKCWADVPQQRPAAGVVYQNVQQLHFEAERDRRPQEGEQQPKETVRKRKRSLKVQEERKRRAMAEEAMQQREKQEWMQKGEIEQSATHDDEDSIATIRERVHHPPDPNMVISGPSEARASLFAGIQTNKVISREFTGYGTYVRFVAFSPDGKQVISGCDEGVILRDAQTGAVYWGPLKLDGDEFSVYSVAFSPNGKHIVSGGSHGKVQVQDVETRTLVSSMTSIGQGVTVKAVAFSPDGKYIVAGSSDKTIWMWDAYTGGLLSRHFKGHTASIQCIAFSHDGTRIASGSWDNTFRLWDAGTGNRVPPKCTKLHTLDVTAVSFLKDGKRVASCSYDGTVRLWDAVTGHAIPGPLWEHTEGVNDLAFSPDGRHIVCGCNDGIMVLNVATGTLVIGPLNLRRRGPVLSIAISPDGQRIAAAHKSGSMTIWQSESL